MGRHLYAISRGHSPYRNGFHRHIISRLNHFGCISTHKGSKGDCRDETKLPAIRDTFHIDNSADGRKNGRGESRPRSKGYAKIAFGLLKIMSLTEFSAPKIVFSVKYNFAFERHPFAESKWNVLSHPQCPGFRSSKQFFRLYLGLLNPFRTCPRTKLNHFDPCALGRFLLLPRAKFLRARAVYKQTRVVPSCFIFIYFKPVFSHQKYASKLKRKASSQAFAR